MNFHLFGQLPNFNLKVKLWHKMEKMISKFHGIKLNSNETFKRWKTKIKKILWNKLS